ncbi:MAG TPA: hypothetical protein VJ973_04600 [Christiangramia sp.]|nr:hypothetical protein [Christiangramia sp.]
MKTKFFLLFLIISVLIGCESNPEKPSQVRIGQFLFSDEPIDLTFKNKDDEVLNKTLNYGDLTSYENLKSGIYDVEISLKDQVLLKKKIGIGTDGIYTLILNGFPKENQKVNEKTGKMRLHEIVEGEEAIYPNGNLPQMRILNDEFECGKDEAKIRWIHLAAGVEEVNATVKTNSKSTDLSSLTYPKLSKDFSISPEKNEVLWQLKGSAVEVSELDMNTKSNYLYTCFLIGKKGNYIDHLKVVVGETPKKGF